MDGRSLLCLASHTLMLWTAVGLVFSQRISSTNEKTTLRLCQGRNRSANVGDETPICLRPEPFSQARLLSTPRRRKAIRSAGSRREGDGCFGLTVIDLTLVFSAKRNDI